MSTELFKNRFRVPSARAEWHNYNGGMYFVTICTAGREHYFGEIVDGEMRLSVIGDYTRQCIENIAQHNRYANVPLYVIMPNHLHLIVVIDDVTEKRVPTSEQTAQWRACNDGKNQKMQDIANHQGRLSTAVGGFKQSVTRYARANHITFAWQTRFHEHIIRKTDEMNRIAEYIENNVAKWNIDEFNV